MARRLIPESSASRPLSSKSLGVEQRVGMNLIEILQRRAESLIEGPYTVGLRSVVQHVQVAVKHLERGQRETDDTAFTDAICRTNQAFEGSLKEAYRVLAGKDPDHARPFDIENYFAQNTILRPRVLAQLSTYRTEWRNPSAHDYKLDFDEDEALLAIVTVCAFSIVLFDQIAERVSFLEAQKATAASSRPIDTGRPLLDVVADAVQSFRVPIHADGSSGEPREVEVVGALAGFLSNQVPSATINPDVQLVADRAFRVDLVVAKDSEQVLLEVKRSRPGAVQMRQGINQLTHYMALGGAKAGLLFFYSAEPDPVYEINKHELPGVGGRILIVAAFGEGRLTLA